jgi:hypothetical protein
MRARNHPLPSSANGNIQPNKILQNNQQQQHQPQQIRAVSTNSIMRNHPKTQPSSPAYGQLLTAPQPQPPSSSGKIQPSSHGMKSPRVKSANYVHEKNPKKSSSSLNKTKIDLDSYISTVLSQEKSQLILEGRLVKAGK